MTRSVLEVREPGKGPVLVTVEAGSLEVGRDASGLLVDDDGVSRRHLTLTLGPAGLTVTDLASSNGTRVNGERISVETPVGPGDVIRISDTEIAVVSIDAGDGNAGDGDGTRPLLGDLVARETEAATIRFRPGTAGEAAAEGMAAAVARARRRLAGLGSEPSGVRPQLCLVDPIPDPSEPGRTLAGGTLVDEARLEIWMVVTPECPPEDPERPLALLFGAALPAAGELELLLEGYGLHVAGTPETDAQLRDTQLRDSGLPALHEAKGEMRTSMALSFVRYLVDKGGEDGVRRLFAEAQPGRVDETATDVFGAGLGELEASWRRRLAGGERRHRVGFLKLVVPLLGPHARRCVEMLLTMVLGLAFTVVFPFAFRRLLDVAIPAADFGQVMRILAFVAGAFAVTFLAELRRAYLAAYVSAAVARRLREQMFERLQTLSMGWLSSQQEGDVTSRFYSDVTTLETGLVRVLAEGLDKVLGIAVSCVILLTLNVWLGLVVLAGAPVVVLVYKSMAAGAGTRSLAVQEDTGRLVALSSENYGAQSVVKAFALEEREQARYSKASAGLFASQVRMELFGGLFGLSVNVVMTVLRLVVLGAGAWLVFNRGFSVGGLVAFLGVMSGVLSPISILADIARRVQASTGALVRIGELLGTVPDVSDADDAVELPAMQQEIRLDQVGFSYSKERRTLEGLDATIPAHARVAFVGPTGAGKSSVLRLVMRFYDPDEGAVRFDGQDVRGVTMASLRGQLGVVFQETSLFDTTIRENIAVGRASATDEQVEAAARAAELHEFIVSLPQGYETPVGERGARLSGGQRQRLAIARALVREPSVLLLDEATSALDPRTERLIAATLERVGEGRTTIAVTHRLTSITGYDRIFVMVDGKLAEAGTHDELVAAGGVYAGLWADQTGGDVRAEAPFDLPGALARVPLFAGLEPDQLATVAARCRPAELAPGERVREGGGRLVLVRRGRPRVFNPNLQGELVPSAELAPGDAFGLSALLGDESGSVLVAESRASILVLDDEAIAGLSAAYPAVAAALEGRVRPVASPAGGRRLSRLTGGGAVGLTGLTAPRPGGH